MDMLKALMRGGSGVGDRFAFAELDRAIRGATMAFAEARRALAATTAEREREANRLARLMARADDLEERAVLALQMGRTDLAEAAAQAIATIETERDAARAVEARYTQDVARLRDTVERQRRRLADLDRGRRLARVNAAVARTAPGTGRDAIGNAESLLDELRLDQARDLALVDMDDAAGEILQDQMAEAGLGAPLRPLASTVLRRIEARAATLPPSSTNPE